MHLLGTFFSCKSADGEEGGQTLDQQTREGTGECMAVSLRRLSFLLSRPCSSSLVRELTWTLAPVEPACTLETASGLWE